jgi:hypothetical protein
MRFGPPDEPRGNTFGTLFASHVSSAVCLSAWRQQAGALVITFIIKGEALDGAKAPTMRLRDTLADPMHGAVVGSFQAKQQARGSS